MIPEMMKCSADTLQKYTYLRISTSALHLHNLIISIIWDLHYGNLVNNIYDDRAYMKYIIDKHKPYGITYVEMENSNPIFV